MKARFDKWWLLPLSILAASALVALNVVVFEPSSIDRSSDEVVAQRATSEAVARDCSGDLASDYACHQERYQDLIRNSGVEAAFAELKDEHEKRLPRRPYPLAGFLRGRLP